MRTGILLPRSSTHPLIAYNFIDGVNAFLKYHELTNTISCVPAYIGFGADPKLIQQEAERLLIEQQVDLLVVFADSPTVECLFPMVTALNKLLIVVNHGAKYPLSWAAQPNVIHHSLNNAVNCWLTGKKAGKDNKAAAVVTSFYDGGYSINHSLAAAFTNEAGQITFNFVGHQYKTEFNTTPLISFLNTAPEVDTLLTILSGELVPEFYLQLRQQMRHRKMKLYASPVLIEESLNEENLAPEETITISGYTSWFKDASSAENKLYCDTFTEETSRTPDSFGVLGWDTALLLKTIHQCAAGKKIDAKTIASHPDLQQLQGAKGLMKLHTATQRYISPAHYIHSNLSNDTSAPQLSPEQLSTEEVEASFNELINFEIQGPSSGWLNTYLCS